MAAAFHLNHNQTTIYESNHMTNIMPQAAIMNQQAYLAAEEIFDCWRNIVNLKTIVGIVMGNNASNDYFVASHGVKTPDNYWRIIKKEYDVDKDGDTIIAWLFVIFIYFFINYRLNIKLFVVNFNKSQMMKQLPVHNWTNI